jgi:antirestriction protein ArdC
MSFDLYQGVTNQIIAMLDTGVVPWRSPILGKASAGHPKNLHSGKRYRGVNVFLLAFTAWAKGYGSSCWLTFNQAKALGGTIKKGEKSSTVIFWKQLESIDEETQKSTTIPLLRYFNVFNVEQCDGIQALDVPVYEPIDFQPIEQAEHIVERYLMDGPTVEHAGQQAVYMPVADSIRIPEPNRFTSSEEYYATLFHELAHSTGHSQRLDRKLDTQPHPFGTADYGKEELIAEMAAAFLCGDVGIQPAVIDNQAAYIGGWLKTIKKDKRLVIAAAAAAQKAADWIHGVQV